MCRGRIRCLLASGVNTALRLFQRRKETSQQNQPSSRLAGSWKRFSGAHLNGETHVCSLEQANSSPACTTLMMVRFLSTGGSVFLTVQGYPQTQTSHKSRPLTTLPHPSHTEVDKGQQKMSTERKTTQRGGCQQAGRCPTDVAHCPRTSK